MKLTLSQKLPEFSLVQSNWSVMKDRSLWNPRRRDSDSPTFYRFCLPVLIFALLGYVVFRSTRKQKVEEPEPELSVDALLAATSDNDDENLEDIGYSEKSETRKLIEKFVDENPDAAALLLLQLVK